MALYLDPVSAPRRVVAIRFLCHHALQCGHQCEPLLRQGEVARLRHQLQAGVQAREEVLESLASVTQRQRRERNTAQLEHVENEKDRGSLQRYLPCSAPCDRQALLHGSIVCMARLGGDDDFAVQQRPSGQTAGRLCQFRKRGREIAKVSTEHLYVASCPMPEQASEPEGTNRRGTPAMPPNPCRPEEPATSECGRRSVPREAITE